MKPHFLSRSNACTAALVLLLGSGASLAAPSPAPGPAFPNFASAEALKAACDQNLARANKLLRSLEARPADGRWLAAYDAFNADVEDLSNPHQFLSAVHPDKGVREASEACELRWNDFSSTLGQNEKLFRAARQVKPRDAVDRELLKTMLEGFEDAGVALPPQQIGRAHV
jgi:thimet oligopeptidase